MRAVIQRCTYGKVTVAGQLVNEINSGLVVLLGVRQGDGEADAKYLIDKIINMRIFPDEFGKMNISLLENQGELLLISQFTLYADVKKGRRPAFTEAATYEAGEALYLYALDCAQASGLTVKGGRYGADMQVELLNDGPVTIIVESQ